jgi:hypothetical protein
MSTIQEDSPYFKELLALERKDELWCGRIGVPEDVKHGDLRWVKVENGGEWLVGKFTEEDGVGWLIGGWELPVSVFLVGTKVEPPAK